MNNKKIIERTTTTIVPKSNNNNMRQQNAVTVTNQKSKRPRRARRRRRRKDNAFVSLGQPIRGPNNSDSITITGNDRFAHIEDISVYSGQSLIMEIPITAAVFPRLEKLAGNYQNWRLEWLRFKICPQVSTMTNGGYVSGVSRDPEEVIGTGVNALNAITSLEGAQTMKWWQDTTVHSEGPPKNLFCAETGETRLYADSIFYFAVDGKATEKGSVTVYVDYKATLMKPVLRNTIEPEEENLVDQVLTSNLYFVYVEGTQETGFLINVDPETKKIAPLQDAFTGGPSIPEGRLLYFNRFQSVPAMKLDSTVTYNFSPDFLVAKSDAIDGVNGFEVVVSGHAILPSSAAIGVDYSTASGGDAVFFVPGPREGTTLRQNGFAPHRIYNVSSIRRGIEFLSVKQGNNP